MSAATNNEVVLAVDPGRGKCGLAVLSGPSPIALIERCVVDLADLPSRLAALNARYPQIDRIIVGNGTGSAAVFETLRSAWPSLVPISVDERCTSEQARRRFVRDIPAAGWRRLIPPSMRSPERPYDDFVATILAEAYFAAKNAERHPPSNLG